jgi:hypothetical protein
VAGPAGWLAGWLLPDAKINSPSNSRRRRSSLRRPDGRRSINKPAGCCCYASARAHTRTQARVAHTILPPRKYVRTKDRTSETLLCVCVCMHAARCNELIVHNIARCAATFFSFPRKPDIFLSKAPRDLRIRKYSQTAAVTSVKCHYLSGAAAPAIVLNNK